MAFLRIRFGHLPLMGVLLFAVCFYSCSKDINDDVNHDDIVILFDNDVHCAVDGYAKAAALKDLYHQQYDHVAIVSCGDAISGSSLGAITHGSAVVDIMNAVGYDAVCLGNHAFDYGVPRLIELSQRLTAPIVCCNFCRLNTSQSLFPAYTIKRFGSTDVAFVGVLTPTTLRTTRPSFLQDQQGNYSYSFGYSDDVYALVQQAADQARSQGADYVVVLSHLGIGNDQCSSLGLIAHTSGIDVVLDGHDHVTIPMRLVTNSVGRSVPLASTGSSFENIGRLIISSSGTVSTSLIPISEVSGTSPSVQQVIEDVKKQALDFGSRKVGTSLVNLMAYADDGSKFIYGQETNLGDFGADALRLSTSADVAIVNGGGFRSNISVGDITYNDLLSLWPFSNNVSKASISGLDIVNALEMGVRSLPSLSGSFLQVSGLRFEVDTTIPSSVVLDSSGAFVDVRGPRRVSNVCVYDEASRSWSPISLNANYTVPSFNYILLQGGDGFVFPSIHNVVDDLGLDVDCLDYYISHTLSGVVGMQYAQPQSRISIH